MLLEIHQPVRHLQVADIVQRARGLEGAGIFAVRIDHHHMALRRHLADAMQDQRRRGRFAGAGRAEQREMLAEHRIDVQGRADVARRIDRADLDMGAILGGVDLLQVRGRHREDRRARCRIARHAAAELVELARQPLLVALAEKVDIGGDMLALELERADIGDQPGRADAHLHLAADLAGIGDGGIGIAAERVQRLRIEQHLARRAGNLQHRADRLDRRVRGQAPGSRNRRRAFEPARAKLAVHRLLPVNVPKYARGEVKIG